MLDRLSYERIVLEVGAELERATRVFPNWPEDPVHAIAIVGEEFGELTKAVLEKAYEPGKATRDEDIRMEAIQTAAMAIRFAMYLEQYVYKPCAYMGRTRQSGAHSAA